jgi:hypothetical protein
MILYLSGPMTGITGYNFPAFNFAAESLECAGYSVINPADHGAQGGEAAWIDYIIRDIGHVFHAHGLAMLPAWETSRGARIEVAVAINRHIPIRDIQDWITLAQELKS